MSDRLGVLLPPDHSAGIVAELLLPVAGRLAKHFSALPADRLCVLAAQAYGLDRVDRHAREFCDLGIAVSLGF